jgi:hypothetical protein
VRFKSATVALRPTHPIPGGAILALLGLTSPALAGEAPLPAGLSVAWQAPRSCPDAAHVRAAVASMLGESTAVRGTSGLAASGTVTEIDGRLHLQVRLDSSGASEDKAMDADACATLADAYALVVAFTYDPSLASSPPPAMTAAAVPLAPPPTQPGTPAPVRIEAPATVGPGFRLAGGPLAAVGAGALPFPAYGVGARVALETGARWELAGMFWPSQSTTVAAGSSGTVGAGVWLADAEPSVCLPLAHGAVAPCVGGALGAMHARGTGVTTVGVGTSWWVAVTAGVSLRAALAPGFDIRFRLDVGVPIFRPSFELDDVGSEGTVRAFQPAPAFGALSIEPELRFFSTNPRGAGHDSP